MKIYLIAFSYRGMCTRAIGSLLQAATNEEFKSYLGHLELMDNCDIGKSRSRATTHFFDHKKDCDVLLMLDDDMSYKPQDLLRVSQAALDRDGIVTPLMAVRKKGAGVAFWPKVGQSSVRHPSNDVVEVSRTGTGIMAIARTAVEKISEQFEYKVTAGKPEEPFWPFFLPFIEDNRYYADDYGFCRRAEVAGVKIYNDCLPVVGHHGEYCYLVSEAAGRHKDVDVD